MSGWNFISQTVGLLFASVKSCLLGTVHSQTVGLLSASVKSFVVGTVYSQTEVRLALVRINFDEEETFSKQYTSLMKGCSDH